MDTTRSTDAPSPIRSRLLLPFLGIATMAYLLFAAADCYELHRIPAEGKVHWGGPAIVPIIFGIAVAALIGLVLLATSWNRAVRRRHSGLTPERADAALTTAFFAVVIVAGIFALLVRIP